MYYLLYIIRIISSSIFIYFSELEKLQAVLRYIRVEYTRLQGPSNEFYISKRIFQYYEIFAMVENLTDNWYYTLYLVVLHTTEYVCHSLVNQYHRTY